MPNPTISTTHKRPFQDITDRFVSPRPKRKPKTPGGALGEKLRLRVIETTKSKSITNAFPSSLPPSSPPLYSSSSRGVPLLSSEGEVAREMYEDGGEEPHGYRNDDFSSMLPSDEEGDADAENRAPANLSDPFGFFAVERRLKAEREIVPQPAALHSTRPTDDKTRDDGRLMPSTPHKPKAGTRPLSANANVFSPATTSLASSPSPVKGDNARAPAATDMDTSRELFPVQRRPRDEDEHNDDEVVALPRRKKARQSPEAAVPPRRSTRGQAKVEKDKAAPKSNPKTRARKAPTKTGKKRAVETNDSDDDQQEKFEAERRARVEYFKKLEDYSFEKENVYVV